MESVANIEHCDSVKSAPSQERAPYRKTAFRCFMSLRSEVESAKADPANCSCRKMTGKNAGGKTSRLFRLEAVPRFRSFGFLKGMVGYCQSL
jgi:hypothetical protein